MTNRPICPKGQRKPGSPCIFCEDGTYCAHQYYCPAARQYENTGYQGCRKLKSARESGRELKQEVRNGQKKADTRRRRKG